MLTQKDLKELLQYDPLLGVFCWRKTRRELKAGSIAGSKNQEGYQQIKLAGKMYATSRLTCLYMEGYFPEHEIDHINRVRDDNRWCNLRHVTHYCNMQNIANIPGTPGISWNTEDKKWKVRHQNKYLGVYENLQDAIEAKKTAISGAICFSS